MRRHHYTLYVRWSQEHRCWLGRLPEFQDIVAHASNPVEAARRAEAGIQMRLETLANFKEEAASPAALMNLSGNYGLRMGVERHQDAYIKSKTLELSLNDYINALIDHDVDTDAAHDRVFARINRTRWAKVKRERAGRTRLY